MAAATDVSVLRKAGRLDEALVLARSALAASPSDAYLQRAYGWVIYDLVKRGVQEFEDGKVPPARLANRLNEWTGDYRNLQLVERPGMLHSLLMNQVLKGSRHWSAFLAFAQWWDPQSVRDEDKVPFKADNGKTLPSLRTRFAYAIGRTVAEPAPEIEADLVIWGEAVLEDALKVSPDDQWLHYYKSKLLIDKGLVSEARDWLLPVVRRQQRAGWVWSLLGRTFEDDAPEKAVTCYFRAVQVAAQPQEVLNTRVRLARLLVSAGRFPEAALQVRTAIDFRERNEYRVPQELAQLENADWYRNLSGSKELPSAPNVTEAAEALLFGGESGQINYRIGVVDNQNLEKGLAHVAFVPEEGAVLPYRKFKGIAELAVGAMVEVALVAGTTSPFKWRHSAAKQIDGFCNEHQGELTQRTGQPFGFVVSSSGDRVFVAPAELTAASHLVGRQVNCLAVLSKDKKREKLGWRALQIRAAQ